jgi:hypothetical protein
MSKNGIKISLDCPFKEGNRRVQRRIMSPNFIFKFSLAPRKSVCYRMLLYLLGAAGGERGWREEGR